MLRLLGTSFAVLSLAATLLIITLPSSSTVMLPTLAVLLAALLVATFLPSNPAAFAAATLLGWFGVLFAAPFTVTDRELNALRRIADRGDEAAQLLISYFEALAPYSAFLMVAVTVLFAAMLLFRAGSGLRRYTFMLQASNGLAHMLSRAGLTAAIILLPLLIVAIMYDVIQRKYISLYPDFTFTTLYQTLSAARVQEFEWHLHAALFLLCLGYAYVKDAHVRIELLRESLSPRTRAKIELAGCLLFMVPYCYVVMKYGTENALRSYASGERSATQTGLDHRFLIKGMLPLGFALIALAGMSVAMRCVVFLWGPAALRQDSGTYAYSHLHPAIPEESPPAAST